jgi:hypothetical protein
VYSSVRTPVPVLGSELVRKTTKLKNFEPTEGDEVRRALSGLRTHPAGELAAQR